MAKVDGIVAIQGTVKGITFYQTKEGMFARAKGGVSKKRVLNDPAFERTRENCVEFGHNAKMGKLVRNAVSKLLFLAKDSRVSSRLAQRMSQIKNLDLVSVRGQRQVGIGIQTAEGKNILKGFDFNADSPMRSIFRGILDFNPITGVVVLADFNPVFHLAVPEGATHTSFTAALSIVDFENGDFTTRFSNTENFGVAAAPATYTFTISEVPPNIGISIHFFLIEFFQEINGIQYSLKNNSYNVLSILEVG